MNTLYCWIPDPCRIMEGDGEDEGCGGTKKSKKQTYHGPMAPINMQMAVMDNFCVFILWLIW